MSELGTSVIKAIEFLTAFHKDVSKLLGCVEDSLRSQGFVPLWGSQSFYDRSATYYSPEGWMPRYLFRLYVPAPGENKELDPLQKKWMFFLVYFTPRLAQEPTAIWGVVSLSEPGEQWSVTHPLLLRDDGPPFLKNARVPEWENVKDRPTTVESMVYRACPLVTLKDANALEELVVSPLIEQFAR